MELKQILNEENEFAFKSKNFSLKKLLTRYLAKIEFEQEKEYFTYVGAVNLNFERSELGVYRYQNGDIYLGNWNRNVKEGIGIFYSTQPFPGASNKTFYNVYIGNWTCNTKNGNGIYLRILLNKELNDLNNTTVIINKDVSKVNSQNSLDESKSGNQTKLPHPISNIFLLNNKQIEKLEIFCGTFKDDEFLEGVNYFLSENNEETIYYGKMNENYEKNDPDGILVTRHNKFIYKGNFVDNKFIKGYVFNANDDNNKLFYIEYEDNEIIDYRNKNYIENYDEIYYNLIKIYIFFNEVDLFYEVIKYSNLSDYYINKHFNYDFDSFEQNYEFLREHVFYFKELFNNIMDSLSL